MTFSLRRLLISASMALLPLAAQAQGFAQDVFQPQRPAATAQPGTGVVAPSIGNAAAQRQQRIGPAAVQPSGECISWRTASYEQRATNHDPRPTNSTRKTDCYNQLT